MAYFDIAQMTTSATLYSRITACAATEGDTNPMNFTANHIWTLCAAPGWADAWAYAINTGKTPEEAGKDPGVITDGMILAEVQQVRNPGTPVVEPQG